MRTGPFCPTQKRTLILFEILIGLSLTAILLTFLFSFFAESMKIEKRLETARMEISNRAHIQTRVQTVLTSLCQDQPHFLYTAQIDREITPSLIAIFDNGVDPDPDFSGPILGRIFLDDQKNLSLASWPLDSEKNKIWRKEILLPQVDRFEFEFLGTLKEKEKLWRTQWPKTESDVPSIIRLKIREKKGPLEFAFILPSPGPLVTYHERKAS